MEAHRRNEIAGLVDKMNARTYRCGVAAESAVRDLWEEVRKGEEFQEWLRDAATEIISLGSAGWEIYRDTTEGTMHLKVADLFGRKER